MFTFKAFAEVAPAVFERVTPDPHTYSEPEEFTIMSYSGSGDVTADVTAVDVVIPPGEPGSSTSGCEAADFADFPEDNVALLQRGTCTFGEKARTRKPPAPPR